MSLRRAALVPLALVLLATPVHAAQLAPQVTDECGDSGTRGDWNGDSMDVEESRTYLDIKSGRVAGLYSAAGHLDGFSAAVQTCGNVSAADGGYSVGWSYGDSCYGTVSWTLQGRQAPGSTGVRGHVQSATGPTAVVSEECYGEKTSPADDGVETVYSVSLPAEAATFAGDTLTFNVSRSLLPAAALRRLAAGTEWANIGVVAMDQGPSLWAGYGDTNGNRGHLTVRTDFALGGAGYTVGEDAPAR